MAFEVGLVFDQQGKTIYWFGGRSSSSIPDTRSLWDILWENRDRLGGVAHTHPWDGAAAPSMTDLTTFDAIERGLGAHLLWPVVTFTEVAYVVHNPLFNPGNVYKAGPLTFEIEGIPQWVKAGPLTFEIEGIEELRERSRK